MAPPTIVLITGANRGLGEGLVKRYLTKPNHVVIALNPHPTSKALSDLPQADGSRLIVIKADAFVERDAHDAVKELEQSHGIEHIDIVIANAGISAVWPTVADVKLADLKAHMEPNVYGVVALYQATRALLKKSSREPVFAPMGSTAGMFNNQPPIPNAAYGPSKAATNWFAIRINTEDDWLNAFVMCPGWVTTELGAVGARGLGFSEEAIAKMLIGVDESCEGMMKVLADTSKEKHGGKMVAYNGDVIEW
ncbi:Uu.00g029790.m01.CDS01 [Anthostomella pinea]|uniref:Uu.00g029790.m01.CDS01 n=1 Tax=Anthostomella pinea TaxID=933095 RepID=A0AAI8V969_9PEZI|nr:Uu.00g029790.m01.CDS01 [Anthostomella pinea]